MISGLSLPAAPATPPAIPTAATATAGTPGFAQALHAADQPAPAPLPGRAAPSPAQCLPGAPPADAAPEPAPEDPAARSSESPPAGRTTRSPRSTSLSPSRPPVGTTVQETARAPARTDAERRSPSAIVSREDDLLVPDTGNDAPTSLQALLASLQPPSDAAPAAPAAAWGAATPALPVAPNASAMLLTGHAAVRGIVRVEPGSAVVNPAAPSIAGDGTGVATRSPAAAILTGETSTTGTPPAIAHEAIPPAPAELSSPLIQASEAQAAPTPASASLQPATQAQLAAYPHSAAFGSELGALSSPLIQASAMQPAPASASLPPVTQAQIAAYPHSAAFGPEFGAQISTFVRHGVERAQLQLHPAEMGPVTVQILVEGANAQVRLWAEQPGTRQALEQAMPALAGQLREGGLTLTGGGVFEQPRQAPEQTRRETGAGGPASAHPTADPAPLAFATPARRRGLVDLVA